MTHLKRIREAKGLSQSQLAASAGVSVRMIQKYEIGEKNINSAAALTVYKLAQVLCCAVADRLEIPDGADG